MPKITIQAKKGIDGKTPSKEELESIIVPLIPSPIKGEDGKSIKGDTGEKGLDGINGVDGKDGKDGDKGDKGERGEKGQKGDKGEDGKDVDEKIISDIQSKVNRALDISSRDYDLKELKDVSPSIANATNGQVLKKNSTTGLWEAGNDTGSTSFITLTDTPNSYSGQAGKYPVVNGTETGLEFGTITPPSTPSLQEVTDVGASTTNDISVPDETYGAGWNGSLEVPTKNALYDKIETLGSGASIGGAMTSGTAGSMLFVSPDAIIAQNNQNLFWDNALKNLLISSTLGSELLTNGTFTGNATGWTVPSGWAYSANTVVHSSNGTGALQPSTALTTVIVGFEYQYSIDVSSMTVGTATLAVGGLTLAITANGTYTGKFVATSNANLTVTPTSTARFTVDNISLKRLSGGAIYAGSHVGDTHTAVKSALGTTTSSGFIAENTTLATSGVQQASPSYLRKGQGFLSNTSASFPFEVQDYVIGKVNITPYGQWINQWRGNNGSWTEFLSFDADPVGLGFNFTGSATSGSNPGSARFATFNNTGSNTWFDFKFSGTRRASFGVSSSGEITFNSTGDVVNFTNSSNSNLAQISTTGIINAGGSFNALRVTAGNSTTTPPTTFSNYGSTSLKTTVITTNTTLNDDYTQVIVDCSSNNSCTGTPSVTACSTYTASGQGTCESHLPCVWDAGSSCSVFDNEYGMGTCAGTSGCSVSTATCTGEDESTCLANDDTYGGSCSWSAGTDCSAFNGNESGCSGQSGCSVNSSNSCPSQFDEGSCTGAGCYWDGMSCTGDNSTCTGTYGAGCSGTYNTGGCTGTYGASCTGTATCTGYGTSGACTAEAGCAWTSGVDLTLPATPEEQTYWIAKDYTSGTLRILPNSGQTVNNTTSITSTSTAGVGWMLTWVESKSNWYIMSKH